MRSRLSLLFISILVINTFYVNAQNAVVPYYDAVSDLFGFKDTVSNKIIVEAKYNGVNNFSEGMAAVNVGGLWDYEDEFSLDETLFGGKWGFINSLGKEIVPVKYDGVSDFFYGFAEVIIDEKHGYINKLGVECIPVKFDQIIDERSGYEVWYGDLRGYYDKSGKEILPAVYLYAQLSGNGLTALVQSKDSTYGLLDIKTKKYLLESKLKMVETIIDQTHFIATKNGQYAVYDFTGKLVIPFAKYTLIDNVDDSLIAVNNGNTMAVCDVSEKFSIPFGTFENISAATYISNDFNEMTYLKASREGKWGCITTDGQVLIPLEYDSEFDYADTTSALKANIWICLDKNNNRIMGLNTNVYKNCELYYDWDLEKNMVSFTVNGNEYVMNMQSKIVGDKDKYWEDVSKAGGITPKKPK